MSYFDFQAVPRYIQCEDVLSELKRHVAGFGKNILVITACGIMTEPVRKQVANSFSSEIEKELNPQFQKENHKYMQGLAMALECEKEDGTPKYTFVNYDPIALTEETAEALSKEIVEKKYDVVIGIGGGKAQDFVRAARHFTVFRMVLVPTVASTNASATNLCVIYNSEGTEITNFWALRECQELVLADPKILIGAPVRTLSAGIGDTIATMYEALNVAAHTGREKVYSASTWEYIRATISMLQELGPQAYQDAQKKKVTNAYESVIALILHSVGPVRAGCVSGVGHVIDEGLIAIDSCRKFMHGELVGYGVIPMMCFDKEPIEKIHAYIDFCMAVGIPVSFRQLGIEGIDKEQMHLICNRALNGTMIQSFPYPLTEKEIISMLESAEETVGEYLQSKQA